MRYLLGCCALELVAGVAALIAGLALGWSQLRW
jgi:hypothetical protein